MNRRSFLTMTGASAAVLAVAPAVAFAEPESVTHLIAVNHDLFLDGPIGRAVNSPWTWMKSEYAGYGPHLLSEPTSKYCPDAARITFYHNDTVLVVTFKLRAPQRRPESGSPTMEAGDMWFTCDSHMTGESKPNLWFESAAWKNHTQPWTKPGVGEVEGRWRQMISATEYKLQLPGDSLLSRFDGWTGGQREGRL